MVIFICRNEAPYRFDTIFRSSFFILDGREGYGLGHEKSKCAEIVHSCTE